jgi:purine-binding chemotaxis protein CheW
MTKRRSQQQTGGTALLDEPVIEEFAPEIQLNEAALEEDEVEERASNNLQGTQQFVTFMAGDEVFAADMSPVKEIIRVPDVVRVPLAPHRERE